MLTWRSESDHEEIPVPGLPWKEVSRKVLV
jgi:hypothetical protein